MKCPVCNQDFDRTFKNLKEDLYYDCSHCNSSLFFKGGECTVLSEGSLDQSVRKEKGILKDSVFEDQEEGGDLQDSELTVPELSIPDLAIFEEEPEKAFEEKLEEISEKVSEEVSEEISEEPEKAFEEKLEEVSEEVSEEDSIFQNEKREGSLEDFSEVTEYGNQQNLGKESAFHYNLILSEINSEEIHKQVKSILEDDALKLDPEKQDFLIKDGVLKISEISPVKVHIIVKSLIGLPVKISWEQHLAIDKDSK